MKHFSLYQWNHGRQEQHVWRELHPGPSFHRECDLIGQQQPPTQGLLWGHSGDQQLSEMQAWDMCAGSRYSRYLWSAIPVYTQFWWQSRGVFIYDSQIFLLFFLPWEYRLLKLLYLINTMYINFHLNQTYQYMFMAGEVLNWHI